MISRRQWVFPPDATVKKELIIVKKLLILGILLCLLALIGFVG